MTNLPASQLYQYLSQVGIRKSVAGKIEYAPVDLNRILEAIVADTDNFLLDHLHSYATAKGILHLAVDLEYPDLEELKPDWQTMDESMKLQHVSYSAVNYHYGNWEEHKIFDYQTRTVVPYDPVTLSPKAYSISILDYAEDCRRLYHMVKKAQSQGYTLNSTEMEFISEDESLEFGAQFNTRSSRFQIDYANREFAATMMGSLLPGLNKPT